MRPRSNLRLHPAPPTNWQSLSCEALPPPASAQAIGLLPLVPPERVELVCDAALRGCGDLILSTAAGNHLGQLRQAARLVNLAHVEDFEELFLTNLYLEPLQED